MKRPWSVHTISRMFARDCSAGLPDGRYVQAVCEPWYGDRMRAAWWVLTGRAHAVVWPKDGELEAAIGPFRRPSPPPSSQPKVDVRELVAGWKNPAPDASAPRGPDETFQAYIASMSPTEDEFMEALGDRSSLYKQF